MIEEDRPNMRMWCSGFDGGIAEINFIFRSVVKMISWFPVIVFGNEPNISMAINSKGPLAGNNFRWRFLLRQERFLENSQQY